MARPTDPLRLRTARHSAALLAAALLAAAPAQAQWFARPATVNAARSYPAQRVAAPLDLEVDAGKVLASIDPMIFGSNLEWFNDAGGLASSDAALRGRIIELAREQGTSNYRFPGGILADYYDWRDGIGPRSQRRSTRHPSDSGSSRHTFGSPEFFEFLQRTGAQGLITVNAGTGSPADAADWIRYANAPEHPLRERDGFKAPIGVRYWEVGNELYLPGNPQEKKITVTPEVYAERFIRFADAMRAADPSIKLLAIGVAKSHIGPDTEYPDWSEKLLARAADRMDMLAVHNAYFPMLYKVKQPSVEQVYPALWASPEAVDESLHTLAGLLARYEGQRQIGIAITEWGALFSLPRADPYWVDHVKTLGTGVYIGRMLQVFMSHPRVRMANYFKLVDRSFMGWIDLQGQAKVPYHVFKLYARNTGDQRLASRLQGSLSYNAPALGVMKAQQDVADVTAIASRDSQSGRLYINLVNRSLNRAYQLKLALKGAALPATGEIRRVAAAEPTAHNGRDIPPEWPYRAEYEPYTSAAPGSIGIHSRGWQAGQLLDLPPFSVQTLVLEAGPATPATRTSTK